MKDKKNLVGKGTKIVTISIIGFVILVFVLIIIITMNIHFTVSADKNLTFKDHSKISGSADEDKAKLFINDKEIKINDGKYSEEVNLKMGINEFKVVYKTDKKTK